MDNDMIIIEESNMKFGEYKKSNVFYIEKSDLYNSIRPPRQKGGKICEFILHDDNKLYFIEAKSSSPKNDFKEFIQDIVEKLHNSLQIFLSAKLNILENTNNESLTDVDIYKINECKIIFLLVFNGHQVDWLVPLKDELEKQLLFINRIWKIEVMVLNDELAKKKKLILDD